MSDIDFDEITGVVDSILKWLAQYRGGTFFTGCFENHTSLKLTRVHHYEWQGNYTKAEWTLDPVFGPGRADLWVHGTNGGLDGAHSCATFTSSDVEIFIGGWINNSAWGKKYAGTYLTSKDNINLPDKNAAWSYNAGWFENGTLPGRQVFQVPGGKKYFLYCVMTCESIDPPRWGAHWHLYDDTTDPSRLAAMDAKVGLAPA